MSKPKVIEKAKNLSLVVLFLSTVLLLYFFWGNISFDQLSLNPVSSQMESEAPVVTSLLKPEQIIVSFGSDNYTVTTPDDLWNPGADKDSFVSELQKFGPAENILVEEITYEQYQQVREIRSIWADFSFDVPISDFCSILEIDKPQAYDVIGTVTSIGYSTADKGMSIFVYDGKNQKYFRMWAADSDKSGNTNGGTDFPAFIDSIEAAGYEIYYPISSYLGVEKNTLIPLTVTSNLQSFPFNQELYSYQTEKINTMAEQFFGGNFDFVRKITEENGTIIYMYGYGQNVLIVNTDGSIEYKEEQNSESTGGSFSEALNTAVAFVTSHGSWEPLEGSRLMPYLKDVIPDPNKKKGYRFTFGLEINGSRLYYEDGDPIVVDVISGQVTYYKRHLIDFDQEDIDAIEASTPEDAYSAVNLIAQNYKYVYDILLQSGEVKPTEDQAVMFENIASLVNNMQVGFVKQADPEITEIKPVWVVSVNDTEVYFDLYSADPIGYSREQE